MKRTILANVKLELPLHKRLKLRAAERGIFLKELVIEYLETGLKKDVACRLKYINEEE